MPPPSAEARQRCALLIEQLGGDCLATRAGLALSIQLGIHTAEALLEYYEKCGPVVFAQDVSDLRNVGAGSAQRVTDLIASLETVT